MFCSLLQEKPKHCHKNAYRQHHPRSYQAACTLLFHVLAKAYCGLLTRASRGRGMELGVLGELRAHEPPCDELECTEDCVLLQDGLLSRLQPAFDRNIRQGWCRCRTCLLGSSKMKFSRHHRHEYDGPSAVQTPLWLLADLSLSGYVEPCTCWYEQAVGCLLSVADQPSFSDVQTERYWQLSQGAILEPFSGMW